MRSSYKGKSQKRLFVRGSQRWLRLVGKIGGCLDELEKEENDRNGYWGKESQVGNSSKTVETKCEKKTGRFGVIKKVRRVGRKEIKRG